MTVSQDDLYEWIEEERYHLWSDFDAAVRRAAFEPDPREWITWSMEMLGIRDRILSLHPLLARPLNWREVGVESYPFWPEIEGIEAPEEARDWVREIIDEAHEEGNPCQSYEMALMRRHR
jgi:hypothetical protein